VKEGLAGGDAGDGGEERGAARIGVTMTALVLRPAAADAAAAPPPPPRPRAGRAAQLPMAARRIACVRRSPASRFFMLTPEATRATRRRRRIDRCTSRDAFITCRVEVEHKESRRLVSDAHKPSGAPPWATARPDPRAAAAAAEERQQRRRQRGG